MDTSFPRRGNGDSDRGRDLQFDTKDSPEKQTQNRWDTLLSQMMMHLNIRVTTGGIIIAFIVYHIYARLAFAANGARWVSSNTTPALLVWAVDMEQYIGGLHSRSIEYKYTVWRFPPPVTDQVTISNALNRITSASTDYRAAL